MTNNEVADKLVGKKQKVYYPWEQKFLERVVHKDQDGYYIRYKSTRKGCKPQINSLNEVIGFEALKYGGRGKK